MSTKTTGGHVNAILDQPPVSRRRRRTHSDEFKADAVAACSQPGVSMAAIALAHGINANLLRRWVRDAEAAPPLKPTTTAAAPQKVALTAPLASPFIPVTVPAADTPAVLRVELRRGATSITVDWPVDAAPECAAWMRELLR